MQLQSQKLLAIWDHHQYSEEKTKIEPIDGQFVYKSLFSVSAFASKQDQTAGTRLAQATANQLLLTLRELRNTIKKLDRDLIDKIGEVLIDTTTLKARVNKEVLIDKSKYTPTTVMLMKIFLTCDEYYTHLNQAKCDGELLSSEHNEYRKDASTLIIQTLHEMTKLCISYHKVRKSIETKQ